MSASPAVQRFLDRLADVKPTGAGKWVARCPCHDDGGRPNLDIAEADDGSALLHCKVCDANGASVCEAFDWPPAALFPSYDPAAPPRAPKPKPPSIGDALQAAAALDEAAGGDGTPQLDAAVSAIVEAAMAGDNGHVTAQPSHDALARVLAWLAADGDRPNVREILPDVAALDDLTYAEHRAPIAKAAGIRMSDLDVERERLRPKDSGDAGSTPKLARPEPWPHPVDGAELLAGIARAVTRYVALPDGAATAIALWILHAHAHDAAHVSPLLAPSSPEKRCGKTTLLSVLTRLVPVPIATSNITPAALFRSIEAFHPTLLIDEADTVFAAGADDRCAELRGVINSGHARAAAYVLRCVGDEHEARPFATWAPKVIALIGHLPDTLQDRSVVIPMRRRAPGELVERLRLDRLDELEPLLRMAARWAADHMDPLRHADPEVPSGLHDRAADNWRPLLAIADRAGGDWPERARKAAVLLSAGGGDDDGSVRTLLLADLRRVMGDAERMASADIVAALVQMEDRPWPEWRRGNPITVTGLARQLGPFGAKPKQLWIDGMNVRGYEAADLADAWARYLPSDAPPPDTPPPSARTARTRASTASAPNGEALAGDNSSASEIPGNPRHQGILADLADENPPAGRAHAEKAKTEAKAGAADDAAGGPEWRVEL